MMSVETTGDAGAGSETIETARQTRRCSNERPPIAIYFDCVNSPSRTGDQVQDSLSGLRISA